VDDQYREFQDRQRALQKEMANQLRQIDFTDTENLPSQIKEIRDSAEREMNELLLPHQVKRLRQLRMQSLLQRRDLVQVLTADPIKSDLKITDEQSQELRDYQLATFTHIYRQGYGSPEVDQTTPVATQAVVSEDRMTVDLKVDNRVQGHVHDFRLPRIRSNEGESLVHADAYYTLNEIPRE
ncbi:hypothetical protein OAK98_05355, partial [Mariniblastus sp.]|nr:hypothetical protein [Mariniblastus sp.]